MAKTITQTVMFKVQPGQIYEAILDPKIHSKFTGAKATGSMKVGGKFTAYDGYISGKNVELIKDKKIVQEWTSTDFPKGYKTQVTFEFFPAKPGTKLGFTQTGVPDENYADIAQGWIDFYWTPLKAMLV
jgi:activator of HSP90 ATPase